MAPRLSSHSSTRSLLRRSLLYSTSALIVGGGTIYYIYRPINVPGSQGAAVPPPKTSGGKIIPPTFPKIKCRDEQLRDLKSSGRLSESTADGVGDKIVENTEYIWRQVKTGFGSILGSSSSQTSTVPDVPSSTESDKTDQSPSFTTPANATQPYDLLIIGGGATGSGIALDAATRGLRVALVERDDFAAGTSSKSTKLVHGGVRYLEKAVWELDLNQYRLVKEALRERKYFLHTAPHLSSWLPIMIPLQKWWQAPYFWAGTKFYDFLAGSEGIETSYFLTRSKALDSFPMLRKDNIVGAMVYYDGAHNDSRMNISLATTAALYGATVLNHCEVVSLTKDENGRLNGATLRDKIAEKNGETLREFQVRAKGIINATGPFCDSIRKMDEAGTKEIVAPSAGVHVILPGYYSPQKMGLIDPSTSDGRVIFFLPWQGNTIAGTTDAPTEIKAQPVATDQDIDWILNEIKGYLAPDINVRRGDVLAAWSGIRPLVKDPKAKNTESLVRNHLVTVSDSGLLTCAGGKWTTYRQMAEDAVDKAITEFKLQTKSLKGGSTPRISGTEMIDDAAPLDGKCQTHQVRLVGAHGYSKTLFINLIQHFGIETEVAKHLTESYGDRAWTVAALSSPSEERWPVRGKRISLLYPFVDGEVRYAVRHEYAQTAVDVIARRTRLAFLNAQAALEALPKVIDLMAEELGWDGRRKDVEWRETLHFLASMGLPARLLDVSRKEVESRKGRFWEDDTEQRRMYSRYGKLKRSISPFFFPSLFDPGSLVYSTKDTLLHTYTTYEPKTFITNLLLPLFGGIFI